MQDIGHKLRSVACHSILYTRKMNFLISITCYVLIKWSLHIRDICFSFDIHSCIYDVIKHSCLGHIYIYNNNYAFYLKVPFLTLEDFSIFKLKLTSIIHRNSFKMIMTGDKLIWLLNTMAQSTYSSWQNSRHLVTFQGLQGEDITVRLEFPLYPSSIPTTPDRIGSHRMK